MPKMVGAQVRITWEKYDIMVSAKDWWRVGDVGRVNGSWSDARDACGF
jgi:hypothetical protein